MKVLNLFLLIFFSLFLVFSSPSFGQQDSITEVKLLAEGGSPGDYFIDLFGSSVSLLENIALIGAPGDNEQSGSAYVFRYDGTLWIQEDHFLAEPLDQNPGDFFGNAVSIGGDVAAIGAVYDDEAGEDAGAVYVYRYEASAWQFKQKIMPSQIPPQNPSNDLFGYAVSVFGDRILVGSMGDYWGSAYVFRYEEASRTWVQEGSKLGPSDEFAQMWFGGSVALFEEVAVVGLFDSENGSQSGAAYVFRYNEESLSWEEEQKLIAPDGDAVDEFGLSAVTISNDIIIVGAQKHDAADINGGAAYIFRYDPKQPSQEKWVFEQKLLPPMEEYNFFKEFGHSLSISEDRIAVGVDQFNGSVYVFQYDPNLPANQKWFLEREIFPSEPSAGNHFGECVSISGNKILAGAKYDNENGPDAGAAYLFTLLEQNACPEDLNNDEVIDSLDLGLILGAWSDPPGSPGCDGELPCDPDLNQDGLVDSLDMGILLGAWGTCDA